MVKSCYIHIPFCKKICSYCDFCKMFYNEQLVDKYLISLENEIESLYKNEVLDTIYIGGGTPSSLNLNQLEKIFSIINKLNKTKILVYTFVIMFFMIFDMIYFGLCYQSEHILLLSIINILLNQ